MTFEQWMLGCFCLLIAGYLAYALVSGRSGAAHSDATRRGDPFGYWFGIAFLIVMLALLVVALSRTGGDEGPPFHGALFVAPVLLHALVETLRTGEARSLSKEPFRRSERPIVYWTHVLILALSLALTATVLGDDLLR